MNDEILKSPAVRAALETLFYRAGVEAVSHDQKRTLKFLRKHGFDEAAKALEDDWEIPF